ncbi:hypothetical protein H4N54_02415 [Limnospira fusiformis KN01]|nr:hypothetical protein [Limnospira fusiformis]ULB46270.1 hypothetical protein H4N54_02415 [Limnospira fusiformis KN01]
MSVHLLNPHKSETLPQTKVTSWESYPHITYPHRSFQLESKRSRFSEVGSWESLPQTESHQSGELLSYHLPT